MTKRSSPGGFFHINYLFTHNELVSSITHINGFICTRLNSFKFYNVIPIV